MVAHVDLPAWLSAVGTVLEGAVGALVYFTHRRVKRVEPRVVRLERKIDDAVSNGASSAAILTKALEGTYETMQIQSKALASILERMAPHSEEHPV